MLLVGTLSVHAHQREEERNLDLKRIQPGMNARQAREILGTPLVIARQIYAQGYLEQWLYEQPEPVRIDVVFRLGSPPQVQAIHARTRPRP